MAGHRESGKVARDDVVTTDLDDLIAGAAARDPEFRAAAADTESRLELLREFAATRRRKKISQTELARLMGTTQSAISEMEKGLVEPRLSTLQRYARILGYCLRLMLAKEPSATYTSRKFRYPSPPMRVVSRRTGIHDGDGELLVGEPTTLNNVRVVEFRRREESTLGGSLAEHLSGAAAA